jgi:2-amino-4-hydroxy-6-hydroxymethyldihydropteridine diphosphokinase
MNNTHTAYLLIGGNIGDRLANLKKAVKYIQQECGQIVTISSIYQTAAWGLKEQPDFLNQVIVLSTTLQPNTLMQILLFIEEKMGRIRTVKLGPRTIDLDILLIDDLIIQSELLTIPHPALPKRKFALIPLAEVAGNLIHPLENKSILQLLSDCKDKLVVQKFSATAI